MHIEDKEEGLKRVIGIPGIAASVFNFTIGAGIFVLPAIIGIQLGPTAIIGYILCGLMFAAIMLCYVEIGSRIKTSGGSYAYVEAALGPFAGFIINWLFFFGWGILSSAAVMNVVADSLAVLFPVFSGWWMRSLLLLLMIAFMMLVNIRGAKESVRFVEIVTIIKFLPLLGIIIFGFNHIKAVNLQWDQLPTLKAFGETALVLFFAFAGFESALSASGEIKNPKRTIPTGILLGGLLVFSTYILLQVIVQGVLGPQLSEFKATPLAAVANIIVGSLGATLLVAAAAISGFGSVSGDVLTSPRLLFAGANDGIFPKFLGRIHPRFSTPHWAVITYASLIFVFSISGGFKQLAVLASGALLLIYFGVILAMIKLRRLKLQDEEKTFKVPGGLLIPGMALAAILWVLSNLSKMEMISVGAFLVVICAMYVIMKKLQASPLAVATKSIEE
ncbi:MAG: amino acid permease [Saprospiraceae bacterium]|nr:amino acid permease [Saprospiraceae bacterium]